MENILNNIIEENFPNLKKEMYSSYKKTGTENKQPQHIITHRLTTHNILTSQNKERILKAAREKEQVTHKGRPIGITPDLESQWRL